jgi:hypothetical protein
MKLNSINNRDLFKILNFFEAAIVITHPRLQKKTSYATGHGCSVHEHISVFIQGKFMPCVLHPSWGKAFLPNSFS